MAATDLMARRVTLARAGAALLACLAGMAWQHWTGGAAGGALSPAHGALAKLLRLATVLPMLGLVAAVYFGLMRLLRAPDIDRAMALVLRRFAPRRRG